MFVKKQVNLNPWLLVCSLANRLRNDSLLRNSVFIMGSTVATSAVGYLYWIVAAHIYSARDIGLASAFISAMTLTSTFVSVGIGSALVQMLPRREAGHARSLTLNACLAMGILTSLLGGTIVAVTLPSLSSQFSIFESQRAYAFTFVVGVMAGTVAILLDQTFVAERATGNMALRNTVFALLKLVLMTLLIQLGALGIFSSWVLALVSTVLFAGLVLVPYLKRGYCLATHGIAKQIRPVLAAFAGHHFINIGGILPMYLLPVFVAIRLSVTDNAYFYTTWMLGSLFFMVSPSVATALFSEGSHGINNVLDKVQTSFVLISVLLFPIMLIFLFAGHYIMLLFGPGYPQHGFSLLLILIISAVPDAITNVYVSLLRVQGQLRKAALLNLSMAAITLILAWILLPVIGIIGAGWAWLIAQSIGSLIVGVDAFLSRSYVRKRYKSSVQESVLRINVGDTTIVGTNAAVAHDIPANTIVGNIPAYVLRKLESPALPEVGILDTAELPTAKLSAINQVNGEFNKIPQLYRRGQVLKKIHLDKYILDS